MRGREVDRATDDEHHLEHPGVDGGLDRHAHQRAPPEGRELLRTALEAGGAAGGEHRGGEMAMFTHPASQPAMAHG